MARILLLLQMLDAIERRDAEIQRYLVRGTRAPLHLLRDATTLMVEFGEVFDGKPR